VLYAKRRKHYLHRDCPFFKPNVGINLLVIRPPVKIERPVRAN
jgi:hypothetical protein